MTESGSERKPDPIDVHVGKRIRARRSLLGVSQEKLAKAVGITFQQVQKYEQGMNRISAGRLFQFSKLLEVPVSFFYEEFGSKRYANKFAGLSDSHQDVIDSDDVLYERETLELLRIYYSIPDEAKRKELMKIIRTLTDTMGAG